MKLIRKNKTSDSENKTEDTQKNKVKLPPWKVLIIDDEPDIHAITRLNLKNFEFAGKQIEFLQAMSGREAKQILETEKDIAVAFVDVVMETDDAGLRLVEYIREELQNSMMRLIIRTGQPGAAPERLVVDQYDIDDYKDKTELTAQKLYTTIRSALKSYRDLTTINNNRKGLEKILDAASGFYQPQSLGNFFDGVLTQLIGLCNLGENSLISTIQNGLVITPDNENVPIQAGTGRFAHLDDDPETQKTAAACLDKMLDGRETDMFPNNMLPVPLQIRDELLGFVCLENADHLGTADQHLIQIMANQCASALRNLQLYLDLREANHQALYMLAVAAEYKDKDTGDHINRLAHYTTLIARALGLPEEYAQLYGQSSMLHDIGKIGIPDAVLQKPGKLTNDEFDVIKTHPRLGAEILGKNKWFKTACEIAYGHHEKWDGRGYPQGLKEEEIPLSARIVAVVDVFDALTHERCYKEAWPLEQALAEIKRSAGSHFDPKIVDVLLDLCEKGEFV